MNISFYIQYCINTVDPPSIQVMHSRNTMCKVGMHRTKLTLCKKNRDAFQTPPKVTRFLVLYLGSAVVLQFSISLIYAVI